MERLLREALAPQGGVNCLKSHITQLISGELGILEYLLPKSVPFPQDTQPSHGGGRQDAAVNWGPQVEPSWEVGGDIGSGITFKAYSQQPVGMTKPWLRL